MSYDVSVVVPLYNARDLVKFTVDSILAQTLSNIEVLLIDDCSTDGSPDLCRELYGQDERVKVLQQPKNMGPGAARNRGIREAQGNYIVFVDSDDEILPDMLGKMLDIAKKYSADVVHDTKYLIPFLDEEGNMPLQMIADSVRLFPVSGNAGGKGYDEITRLTDDLSARFEDWKNRRISWNVFSKMFSRSFLLNSDIHFADMKFAEDMVFCFECLFKAKNYVMVPEQSYIYRLIGTSLSRAKKTSAKIVTSLKAQLGAVHSMNRIFQGIPFFAENPRKAVSALERVLDDIECGYIRPAYQELGEETLRSDNVIHDFMLEEFGDKAPYVEFLFYELHNNYEPVIDYIGQSGDIEFLRSIAKSFREEEQKKQ